MSQKQVRNSLKYKVLAYLVDKLLYNWVICKECDD